MTTILSTALTSVELDVPTDVELELTDKCQLSCGHCLSESSPSVPHGSMTLDDWMRVINECAALGVRRVQLIGGEPTTFPGWDKLLNHALAVGLKVEVFSNLYHVSAKGWTVLSQPGVSLGTSYYSVNAGEHDKVTNKPGSHEKTRANIAKAVALGIPIRAGVVRCHDGQLEELAVAELKALGVQRVTLDGARAVGRAAGGQEPTMDALCGNCALGKLAVLPNGDVAPCVLGRFLPTGNVKDPGGLRAVLAGPTWAKTAASIPRRSQVCGPNDGSSCAPTGCAPQDNSITLGGCPPNDSNDCNPASTEACAPAYFAPKPSELELCVPKVTTAGPVPVMLGGCPPNDSNDCSPANSEACAPKY
ncbi:radical SAM protein [Streptomyces sp. NRRL S-350]|uniref:radical SAM protein n=1 Tax=Streptomyces sp. NRRL S-350 TaxID=1463902 RepID=UPI0007C490AD|nr:radical SAM protein [Streptomyces sp. NRRL S-350]